MPPVAKSSTTVSHFMLQDFRPLPNWSVSCWIEFVRATVGAGVSENGRSSLNIIWLTVNPRQQYYEAQRLINIVFKLKSRWVDLYLSYEQWTHYLVLSTYFAREVIIIINIYLYITRL